MADGIGVTGSDIVIDGLEIYTGDDAVVISPPARNVLVRNVEAHGTHGLSVTCTSGTGGNFTFENAIISDSLMGCRFKGKVGATCTITDVHWRNITMHNVSYPVHLIEDYWDPEKGKPPQGSELAAYATGFTYDDISGQVAGTIGDGSCVKAPCWYFTKGVLAASPPEQPWRDGNIVSPSSSVSNPEVLEKGQSPSKGLYLLCRDAAHCKNFRFSNVKLRTAVCHIPPVRASDGEDETNHFT